MYNTAGCSVIIKHYQGLVNGPVNEGRKITESVTCNGNERGLEKCSIAYTSSIRDSCKLKSSIVSITCSHDSFASCDGDFDVPWGGKCYSLLPRRSSFEEAKSRCIEKGKKLVEVNTQQENDILSELLLTHRYSTGRFSEVWTGGKVIKGAGRSHRLFWDGSQTRISNYLLSLLNIMILIIGCLVKVQDNDKVCCVI